MFGLCIAEGILRGGKTRVHSWGICLYVHTDVKLFVIEVCVCKTIRLNTSGFTITFKN